MFVTFMAPTMNNKTTERGLLVKSKEKTIKIPISKIQKNANHWKYFADL